MKKTRRFIEAMAINHLDERLLKTYALRDATRRSSRAKMKIKNETANNASAIFFYWHNTISTDHVCRIARLVRSKQLSLHSFFSLSPCRANDIEMFFCSECKCTKSKRSGSWRNSVICSAHYSAIEWDAQWNGNGLSINCTAKAFRWMLCK